MRAGTNALSLLAVPLNVHLLCALQEEELSLGDLSQTVGLPPASTMRAYLRTLSGWGLVERRQETAFPGLVSYALTESGEKVVQTGDVLQGWLKASPQGGMALGSPAAKSAVKAIVDGWEAAIVRALAARPCTLTELARALPQISYPALERRLTAMRRVGQVEARRDGATRGTPYGATRWLREGIIPLIAGMAWERQHAPARTPTIGRLDIEAAFLLTLPLLRLPPEVSGSCRLAVELRNGADSRYAGVTVTFEAGRIKAATARLSGEPDAWVSGTVIGWYRWVNRRDNGVVEVGGDPLISLALEDALRAALLPRHRV